jgi:hypothetical protein
VVGNGWQCFLVVGNILTMFPSGRIYRLTVLPSGRKWADSDSDSDSVPSGRKKGDYVC